MNNVPHPAENMELRYENQAKLEKEFEKIDLVAKKLTERYSEYEDLRGFVEYLKGMEKLFARAGVENWGENRVKEEIIMSEIRFFSADSGLDEDVFKTIRDDFGLVYFNVHQVYEAAESLIKKYDACEDCKKFIEYMKKITLIFVEAQKEHWGLKIIKGKMYSFRMQNLSSDGTPEPELLDKIRLEFERMLLG